MAKIWKKNEEKPCSICLKPIFPQHCCGYPKIRFHVPNPPLIDIRIINDLNMATCCILIPPMNWEFFEGVPTLFLSQRAKNVTPQRIALERKKIYWSNNSQCSIIRKKSAISKVEKHIFCHFKNGKK